MAGFETRKKTTELGEALVAELSQGSRSTPLSRWVAHYIADQMTTAKTAKGKNRAEAERQCFSAILQLWENRSALPSGLHPFAGYDAIFRALDAISPDRRSGYYVPDIDVARVSKKEPDNVLRMVKFIVWSDRAARILIEAALESAIDSAETPRTKVYLRSVAAKAKDGDILGVSRLMARKRFLETLDPAEEIEGDKKLWAKRIDTLEVFLKAATAIQQDFKNRLAKIEASKATA